MESFSSRIDRPLIPFLKEPWTSQSKYPTILVCKISYLLNYPNHNLSQIVTFLYGWVHHFYSREFQVNYSYQGSMWSCSVIPPSYLQSAKLSREYVWVLWWHYFYLRQEILPSLFISSSALHFLAQILYMKVDTDGVEHWSTNLLCISSPSR